jgi:predicted ATPase
MFENIDNLDELKKLGKKILASPIGQKTNWIVISGAPNSGKTSIVTHYSKLGYKTINDLSRSHIQYEMTKYHTDKHQVRSDSKTMQEFILWKMILCTETLNKNQTIFFDYALPDNIAFWSIEGLDIPSELWKSALIYRYHKVFILEPLPIVEDKIRTENKDDQDKLTKEIKRVYSALGYDYIFVPKKKIHNRVNFINKFIK